MAAPIIKITFDRTRLKLLAQRIIKALIVKRAYKGYFKFVLLENETTLTYNEFIKFEYWKIEISFRMYIGKWTMRGFQNARVNFKSVILSK